MVTSGTGLLTPGPPCDGRRCARFRPQFFPASRKQAAASMAARGVRASVVRLPPSVHGDGRSRLRSTLIAIAREKGVSAYVGDGLNRWPAVHRLDAARLYRLALEKGSAGARYHGSRRRGRAAPGNRRGNRPAPEGAGRLQIARGGARTILAGSRIFVSVDCPASSDETQERLGWRPTQPALIPDIDRPAYFEA